MHARVRAPRSGEAGGTRERGAKRAARGAKSTQLKTRTHTLTHIQARHAAPHLHRAGEQAAREVKLGAREALGAELPAVLVMIGGVGGGEARGWR